MTRNRVDFPVPLTPTTPIRAPSDTARKRSSKSTRSTRRTATCWRSTRRDTDRQGYRRPGDEAAWGRSGYVRKDTTTSMGGHHADGSGGFVGEERGLERRAGGARPAS